jgi:hypothetical protein
MEKEDQVGRGQASSSYTHIHHQGVLPRAMGIGLLLALALAAAEVCTARISVVSVVGERHSGTNFVHALFELNMEAGITWKAVFAPLKCEDPWPQKHSYQVKAGEL